MTGSRARSRSRDRAMATPPMMPITVPRAVPAMKTLRLTWRYFHSSPEPMTLPAAPTIAEGVAKRRGLIRRPPSSHIRSSTTAAPSLMARSCRR